MPISNPPTPEEMELMQQIIHRHSVSNATFNSMVFAYFNQLPAHITPRSKPESEVRQKLNNSVIEDKVVMTAGKALNNDDLIFDAETIENYKSGGTVNEDACILSSYSAGLLVGLATIFEGSMFNFYKAKKYIDRDMRNTVVFSIKLGSYDVYFGDMSEAHP